MAYNLRATPHIHVVGNVNSYGDVVIVSDSNVSGNSTITTTGTLSVVNSANVGNTLHVVGNASINNLVTNDVNAKGNIYAQSIVQTGSSNTVVQVDLNSVTGIVKLNANSGALQLNSSGNVSLIGTGIISGGTLDGSVIELAENNTNVKQLRSGNVTVQVGANGTTSNTWTFGADGNLTLPSNTSNINYANGTPYGGASPPSPTFIYTNGALTKITYPTGEYKQLTYNNGVLSQLDYYDLTNTKRKVFNYTDNVLTSITESTI